MKIISSQPFYVVKTGNRSHPCHRKGKMKHRRSSFDGLTAIRYPLTAAPMTQNPNPVTLTLYSSPPKGGTTHYIASLSYTRAYGRVDYEETVFQSFIVPPFSGGKVVP